MSQPPGGFDFGTLAGSYDEWYRTRRGRVYDALEQRAVAGALPDPTGGANRLLEVGCGTGHWSAFFSGRGFVVTGVDSSPEMVALADGKRIANASFQVADAHALPFEDGRFDVSAAITTLEFARDAEAVVGEMARCTRRPGGRLLVGTLNALADVNRRRKAAGAAPYSHARFFSPQELKSILKPYGNAAVTAAAFVPRAAWALALAPLTDLLGRALHSPRGAFIVAAVAL